MLSISSRRLRSGQARGGPERDGIANMVAGQLAFAQRMAGRRRQTSFVVGEKTEAPVALGTRKQEEEVQKGLEVLLGCVTRCHRRFALRQAFGRLVECCKAFRAQWFKRWFQAAKERMTQRECWIKWQGLVLEKRRMWQYALQGIAKRHFSRGHLRKHFAAWKEEQQRVWTLETRTALRRGWDAFRSSCRSSALASTSNLVAATAVKCTNNSPPSVSSSICNTENFRRGALEHIVLILKRQQATYKVLQRYGLGVLQMWFKRFQREVQELCTAASSASEPSQTSCNSDTISAAMHSFQREIMERACAARRTRELSGKVYMDDAEYSSDDSENKRDPLSLLREHMARRKVGKSEIHKDRIAAVEAFKENQNAKEKVWAAHHKDLMTSLDQAYDAIYVRDLQRELCEQSGSWSSHSSALGRMRVAGYSAHQSLLNRLDRVHDPVVLCNQEARIHSGQALNCNTQRQVGSVSSSANGLEVSRRTMLDLCTLASSPSSEASDSSYSANVSASRGAGANLEFMSGSERWSSSESSCSSNTSTGSSEESCEESSSESDDCSTSTGKYSLSGVDGTEFVSVRIGSG